MGRRPCQRLRGALISRRAIAQRLNAYHLEDLLKQRADAFAPSGQPCPVSQISEPQDAAAIRATELTITASPLWETHIEALLDQKRPFPAAGRDATEVPKLDAGAMHSTTPASP
ncbi:hypothetical protein G7Y89_g618 [Cudoniella acicularis]|uniref:Uncharacterized protein n=1 Tax=Cudoniella acicularis TaxID=354080 RepID=A0A8H4W858_9HELO|nr:hypothetical protein G7Y89_g618 [Cudoniella acicularis]